MGVVLQPNQYRLSASLGNGAAAWKGSHLIKDSRAVSTREARLLGHSAVGWLNKWPKLIQAHRSTAPAPQTERRVFNPRPHPHK
jgi:hypothetical protein